MEARYDEVLSETEKLKQLGQQISADFTADPTPSPSAGVSAAGDLPTIAPFRAALGGVDGTPVIVAGGYDTENCWEVVDSGGADLIAFGRYFTSNPDLVWRVQHGKELVRYVRPRFYVFPEDRYREGYTDFARHGDNLRNEQDEELYRAHKERGIVLSKPGWQLSQDGVQLGEIFV
jgi:2,4-dienoyl-CoA reductase-like NADH-dependent reductase (Old Yellow Enzyme family)